MNGINWKTWSLLHVQPLKIEIESCSGARWTRQMVDGACWNDIVGKLCFNGQKTTENRKKTR